MKFWIPETLIGISEMKSIITLSQEYFQKFQKIFNQ